MSHFAIVSFKIGRVTAIVQIRCVMVMRGAGFWMQLYNSVFIQHVEFVIETLDY